MYQGQLQLLVPLRFEGEAEPRAALSLEYCERGCPAKCFYKVRTILTLEMAAGNARMTAPIRAEWLQTFMHTHGAAEAHAHARGPM